MRQGHPGLLVSVRCPAEAEAALAGGADLIDIKEPERGPLGRADDAVIGAIVATVAGRRPVSAALGELADDGGAVPSCGLAYVKWGLAGCGHDWRVRLERKLVAPAPPQVVLTAYADWHCARAPAPEQVLALAAAHPGSVLLLDTCCKSYSATLGRCANLLDWLPLTWIDDFCRRCRDSGVQVALAGSLGQPQIAELRHTAADWFAVRGAACGGGHRVGRIEAHLVRQLVQVIGEGQT